MPAALKGPWDQRTIDAWLAGSRVPLRLACTGRDGFPRLFSLWYVYRDGLLCCAMHRDAQAVALLRAAPQVGFEVAPDAPPYHGVRGQGIATLAEGAGGALLRELLLRYLGGVDSELGQWLLSRAAEEVLVSIAPTRLFSWDYRGRMG